MSWKQTLEQAGPGHWVLPKKKTMRCDAHLFLSDELLFGPDGGSGVEEGVFAQVVNACSFPGATRVVLTPDCHVGYGVPIGTAIETEGTLLPTAAGYDIGCGMVQLKTSLTAEDVADKEKRRMWIDEVVRRIGVGIGQPGAGKGVIKKMNEIVRHGAKALGRGHGVTERMAIPVDDDSFDIPDVAWGKRTQLGSLGGGNHFCEMQVDQEGKVWVMLHTGSRGFGWNIAKKFFVEGAFLLGLTGKSEDHIWFDAESPIGRAYWNLHNMAANFAIVNRLLIGEAVCEALEHVFGGEAEGGGEEEQGEVLRRRSRGLLRDFPQPHSARGRSLRGAQGHHARVPRWARRARRHEVGRDGPPHSHSRLDGDGQRDSLRAGGSEGLALLGEPRRGPPALAHAGQEAARPEADRPAHGEAGRGAQHPQHAAR